MKIDDIDFLIYCGDFSQEVYRKAEEDGVTREDAFTEIVLDSLGDADIIENGSVCSHRQKKMGVQVSGYAINDNQDTLDLFISIFSGKVPPDNLPKSEIDSHFRRLELFFNKSCKGYHNDLEIAQPVYDCVLRIFEIQKQIRKVRFFLLTDRTKKVEAIPDKIESGIHFSYNVWDIVRFYGLDSSDAKREPIEIDLSGDFQSYLPCIYVEDDNPVYISYLVIFPGKTLVDIYEKYGPRLFERNVRSFLQVRGDVNKGIRDTILNEPEMFLAYNNGLSTTAEDVSLKEIDCRKFITRIKNFQIVNGAQTTATLHNTYYRYPDKVDLNFLQIPVKLTVLRDLSELDALVPKISEYANTQNEIKAADFTSNHPFHVEIEALSRQIRAPAIGGSQIETYWYFERVRGQFADERNREKTPAQKKAFDKRYPKNQKFEKTEISEYDYIYKCRPSEVCLGKQKNYKKFMAEINENNNDFVPDEQYFKDLIAKAILYKNTYAIVQKKLTGGYRPEIVRYTLALLFYRTEHKIDLDRIWKEQDLSSDLKHVITEMVFHIQEFVIHPPDSRNIGEWCKKIECWEELLKKNIEIPDMVKASFISAKSKKNKSTALEENNIYINSITDDVWSDIIEWSRETGFLDATSRVVASKILEYKSHDKKLTDQLVSDATDLLEKSADGGFDLAKRLERINTRTNNILVEKAESNLKNEDELNKSESTTAENLNDMQNAILYVLHQNHGKISQKQIYYELVKIGTGDLHVNFPGMSENRIIIRTDYLKEKMKLVKIGLVNPQLIRGDLFLSGKGKEYCVKKWHPEINTSEATIS
jgi:hypothetical protein